MAVFNDIQQGTPALCVKRLQSKVIEYQQFLPLYLFQVLQYSPFSFSNLELSQKLRGGGIHYLVPVLTGMIAQCCSRIAFACSGTAGDEKVFLVPDKIQACQTVCPVFVQSPLYRVVQPFY